MTFYDMCSLCFSLIVVLKFVDPMKSPKRWLIVGSPLVPHFWLKKRMTFVFMIRLHPTSASPKCWSKATCYDFTLVELPVLHPAFRLFWSFNSVMQPAESQGSLQPGGIRRGSRRRFFEPTMEGFNHGIQRNPRRAIWEGLGGLKANAACRTKIETKWLLCFTLYMYIYIYMCFLWRGIPLYFFVSRMALDLFLDWPHEPDHWENSVSRHVNGPSHSHVAIPRSGFLTFLQAMDIKMQKDILNKTYWHTLQ